MSFTEPALSQRGRAGRQTAIARNISDAPIENGPKNLSEALAAADEQTVLEGSAWYENAHNIATGFADTYGFTVEQTSGVIAALSPQTGWGENIKIAERACDMGQQGYWKRIGGHTQNACGKAEAILRGADPRDVLGGRKVRSFYMNILNPELNGPVTIDRHMIDLLAGQRGMVNSRVLEKIGVYTQAAGYIRSAAREMGLLPLQTQAIAWIWWRNHHEVREAVSDPSIRMTTPVLAERTAARNIVTI